jgi:hypothetical protein
LRTDLKLNFHFSDELDVEWAGHPNWFSGLVSSYCLLKGKYFIETTLLRSELTEIPDLENLLKPLFSFFGD